MIITSVETFALRIPFKPGNRSTASAWGESFRFIGAPRDAAGDRDIASRLMVVGA